MTRRWPVAGVVLAGLWLFVRGIARTGDVGPFAFGVTLVEETVVGLAVGLPLAYYTRGLYGDEIGVAGGLRALPYGVVYVVLFLKELVTANVEVAYRVLAPSMPIEPGVVEVPLRVESDLAVTTIANSITLTPGTLTMDYDPERNALYVHTLAGRDRSEVVEPIRRWEDYALMMFGERRSPDDPVPDAGTPWTEPDDGSVPQSAEPDGGGERA
ncbi:cation transporter [Halobacteriales archaeon SW_12_71_31]|nr:MAG: cation transporter [Halobacteriales archaeon SW_12_71_31]